MGKIKVLKFQRELDNNFRPSRNKGYAEKVKWTKNAFEFPTSENLSLILIMFAKRFY